MTHAIVIALKVLTEKSIQSMYLSFMDFLIIISISLFKRMKFKE